MKPLLIICTLLLNTGIIHAQQGRQNSVPNKEQREARLEKMESMKIAHISQKLNLDPKTAEVFWPIYNQYENEMRAVLQEARALKKDGELDADKILDEEQKALDIKRKYTAQFSKVLRPEQVSALFMAEREFRQMLMRKVREGNNGRGPQGPMRR